VRDERGAITILRAGIETMPNPFSGSATIRISTVSAGHAKLTVANTLGKDVAVLLDDRVEAGIREIRFDATGLPSGTYFARLQNGARVVTRELKVQN
jgi:hypothetical protein